MTRGLGRQVEELFARFVEALVVEGTRLDPRDLCEGDEQVLEALLGRIAQYEELDQLLSKRRRLRAGQRLGCWEILEEIGRGAMGVVYLAHRLDTGERVALKLFPPEREGDAEALARFEREALVIRRLNHPNVVKFHSLEEVEGLRFLTMEFVDGTTLAQDLPEGGFHPASVLDIAIPLANALACMHREQVIHRDLKLSNLMRTRNGQLRILDFGLVRFQGEMSESLTVTGKVLGTICTMSPEQLLGGKVSPRSDLFSLGAVLYELATGRSPFAGESLTARIHAVLEKAPEPIPKGLEHLGALIERCLEKEPDRRPCDASEVEAELRRLAGAF